ncbi:MAG TPA: CHASE2 domain-containing protein [Vicinamibacterales bacterium]|nr:CHASE2 domain-containing protein [Vicinamibacterales bacterium]
MRRLIFRCGVAPVLITAVLALYRPSFLSRLDAAVFDTVVRWTPVRAPGDRIVIVDIDERSLSTIGQWPWQRDMVGRLIARLREMGASTVAVDIIFAEPDRFATGDDALAATLRDGRVVMGYAMRFDPADAPAQDRAKCVLHPIGLAVVQAGDESGDAPYFHATNATCVLPALAQAAGATGFLNAAPDADGLLRRVPVLMELDGRVYPSLALAAVTHATAGPARINGATLRIDNVNASTLTIGARTIPLDGKSNLLVRYRGRKHTFPYLSAADVMNGRLAAGALRDKIVFVGTTALGTREVVATPLDTLFAGVEVQATVADNLLAQDPLRRPGNGAALESLATLVAGMAVVLLVAATPQVAGAAGSLGGVVAVWAGAVALLSSQGFFVSPLAPTLAVTAAVAIMTLARSIGDRRRADTAGRQKTNAQQLMVKTLLSLTETRDLQTGRHSRRTQQYANVLAAELSTFNGFKDYLTPARVQLLSSLAPLHDIGKVGIPDAILNKPGALTPDELAEMRKHPALGYEVILKAEKEAGVRDDAILTMAKEIVYTHHEKWDGTGYPRGLKAADIPIPGRVMAVVDVYDATVTRTLYRTPMNHDAAVAFIVRGRGTHFDPAVIDAFVRIAPVFESISASEAAQDQPAVFDESGVRLTQ